MQELLNLHKRKYQAIELMNQLGSAKVPFLFMVDFELLKPLVIPLNELNPEILLYDMNGKNNTDHLATKPELEHFNILSERKNEYSKAFQYVMHQLKLGNSYLANLTFKTKISTNLNLCELFYISKAKYKIFYNNEFVCFSPETFITIENGIITSCPMKGTIDASIPNAEEKILLNHKEIAEHNTMIDLIRNDLSRIAKQVKVTRYRYIEKIIANNIELLQVSSAISGVLPENYKSNLGNILFSLLPAGSISGAPKEKTIEIIKEAEQIPRGYYTGVCGIFDGEKTDCGVMIRFIENSDGSLYFRSGGGITAMSNLEDEYQEMINKIYVPIN